MDLNFPVKNREMNCGILFSDTKKKEDIFIIFCWYNLILTFVEYTFCIHLIFFQVIRLCILPFEILL